MRTTLAMRSATAVAAALAAVLGAPACGSDDAGSSGGTTEVPGTPSSELTCTPGMESADVDATPAPVVVTVQPIAAGTSVEEAIAAGALVAEEICAGYRPPTAVTSLDALDPGAVAIMDLLVNVVITTQFG